MKQELRQIYRDLSNGKLSQKEAFEKVKAIKLQEQGKRIGALLVTPIWQASGAEASTEAGKVEYAEHHVILCELSKVDAKELGASVPYSRCLLLQAEGQKNIAQRYGEYALACFERIQAILRGKPAGKTLAQIVVGDHQEQALFAGLSGLLKTAALENPQFIGQLILVPTRTTAEELGRLLQEEKTRRPTAGLDPLIRYEQGARQVLRWQEALEDQEAPPIAFKDHGVYLITGGLGGLGLLFAREILAQARRSRVVLTGRSAIGAEKQSPLDGLSAPEGWLSYRQVDLGDPDQVKRLIAGIQDDCGQLNGILHCAGMIADNFILKKTGGEFREVLEPKVTGTYNLDQASRDVELGFFALFSSIAGALGNVGQADYAAANGFMDQFAAYRNRQVDADERRGRTLSINWPLWQAGGMGIDPASRELLRQTTGIQPMGTATGLRAFYRSLALPDDQTLVVEGDLTQIRRALLAGRPIRPELAPPLTAVEQSVASETDAVTIDSDGFEEKTQDYLRRQLSEQLKLPSHKIDPQAALEKYGIDSILAMKLTNQLEKTFGSLPKTLFFEYQTIRELAEYFVAHHSAQLAALLAPAANRQSEAVTPPASPRSGARRISSRRVSRLRSATPGATTDADPIAIIGLSGRYPEAVNIEAFWRNLREGKDCIIEVPRDRWDWREYFSEDRSQSGRHYSKWGGFIAGVDEFDPLFFNIAPKEAKYIDPQERLFLQHVWMAIEDAGYTRASLQTSYEQDLSGERDLAGQVGVYVGVMYTEYQLFGAEAGARGKRLGIAGSAASIANRVSYTLNLHGPSMTLDTMCSSSLTAIHVACQDLKLGRTSLAIAGGVNVSIHPNKYLVLSAGQFISSDGHCQSFGEGGDGYIPGEGVGVVVLKRLSDAQRDGDHIYGIIRGSAINHGGKTNGYTVPNPQAQAGAISRALAESRTDARHISYIEAHGTGTRLGDPIEIAALSKAFQRHTQETEFCLIGSVKSNIGHCESAAGIAGLTKVLLQLRHQQIAPSLHSTQLNPHIDFQTTPFVVNQELKPWEPPVIEGRKLPRIAGISSFGAGGSNAHLIVEEYQEPSPEPTAFSNVVILLSARTAEQLRQKAHDLLEFVRSRPNAIDLYAMAYTLQVGREAMEERLGFEASSVEQLAENLQAYVAGDEGIEDVYQGQAPRNKEALSLFSTDGDLRQTIDKWIANRKYSKLLELWVKGVEVDWGKLYGEVKPRRVSLPTYPFAKERYWVDTAAGGIVAASAAPAALHPLLHNNTSDLSHQSYSSTFSGEEFFMKDHQVDGQRILPSAAYLEMARVAVTKAARVSHETVLELRNVVWAQPIVGAQYKQISIALLAHDHDEIGYEIYSQDADEEIVHCQGRAVLSRQPAPARLDLERLKEQMGSRQLEPSRIYAACARMGLIYGPSFQGIAAIHRRSDQLLAQLRLPRIVEDTSGEYVLHPSLVDSALQAGVALINGGQDRFEQPRMPFALDSLRIVSPCVREMVAWARYSPGSQAGDDVIKLDIDLCDEQGNVCAQMRGVSLRQASLGIVEPILDEGASPAAGAAVTNGVLAAPLRKEIVLAPSTRGAPTPVERKKPAVIALEAPSAYVSAAAAPSANKGAPITLSTPGAPLPGSGAPAVSSVRVYDDGNGIFSIEIAASVSDTTQPKDVIAQLLRALDRAQQEASVKVLMLSGLDRGLLRGGREAYNEAIEQNLYQALVAFPYPLIALLQGDTIGAGFLAAALCDFMVCNEDATYGYTDAHTHLYPTTPETILFSERFGDVRAQDFLHASTASTGKQLRSKGWTCPILPAAQVEVYAQKLASTLATKSQDALCLLKQHLARRLVGLVKELTRVEAAAPATQDPTETGEKTIASPAKHIHLDTPAEHVLVIKLGVAMGVKDLVADLGHVFSQIHKGGYYKAIVLVSEHCDFLPATDHASDEQLVFDFERLVAESQIPVVAALDRNATGHAWLIGQLCDGCVYSQTGVYSTATIAHSPGLAQTAAAIFTHRFGATAGTEIILTGADYSGGDLHQRVGALVMTEHDQVLPTAVQVAASWAKLPRATLAAWKKHTATTLREKIRNLPAAAGWEQKDEALEPVAAAPAPIALHSHVVTATAHLEGIVVVKMEDREAKNMFSDAFMEGVREAFAHIEQTPAYKVVILIGFDSYFASGGTKESLLAIQQGKAKFTDFKLFQLPLDCKLPVIAAMQGHGIGAGWTLGMFADLVLLSEESRYVSPYMNYGFTPGAGATWILADKIGQDLARESLLTAQDYAGSDLKDRGLRLPILPRAEVYPAAMALAKRIARVSRGRLIGLKQQLTGYVRQPLEETYRLELAMHAKTFVGQSDTLAQIQNNFYPATGASPVGTQQSEVEAATPSPPSPPFMDGDVLPAITASLKTLLADELLMRESDLDQNVEFVDLGLDSISGVAWIRKINEKYHTSIEATKVYSYPTLTQLARYVKAEAEKHSALSSPGAMPAAPSGSSPSSQSATATKLAVKKLASWRSRTASRFTSAPATYSSQPIAVIGMAGQFPQAKNLEEFWQNIAQGKNCITQVPPTRWDVQAYYQPGDAAPGKTNSQWVGALEEYDLFDPLFFNISPTEAESMDPQQRLFLQACWHTIENAGYDARVLSGSKCGVFVGCGAGDYHQLSRQHQLSAQGFTGSATSILAARISYFLNLQGPCISIDTACSSSLVAIAQACDSLTSGGSDLALAGGVCVMAAPELHIKTSQAGMLSPEGRCFTFDQRADGFVPGEGVGVVLLKRLADAQKDQDIIYGVIQGWGVNQDGKTNGITAPNPESQTRLERNVYDKYRIDPENIQLIEAHGTGTKLGDPIEVEALKEAFKKYTQKKDYCALGSVKSNIGHCLTAAGIAGFLKLVLALKHKRLPPTINFERLNEHIDLTGSPFYVNTRLQPWEPGGSLQRQAATSSFGFSGTNAHIVISEYVPPAEVKRPIPIVPQSAPTVIPLSARTVDQLQQKARELLDFIRKDARSTDLLDIAYTLQVGRAAMDERLGFLAPSVEQLAAKLEAYVNGEQRIEGAYQGHVKRDKEALALFTADADLQETIDKWIANKKLPKLLDLWVKGLDLDWSRLYGEVKPQRISLPTYPFAKERYWIDAAASEHGAAIGASPSALTTAVLHPLLHSNTSDLSEQRYSSTFTGDEFFLVDHQVAVNGHAGQSVLPGVAYLEMARVAIEHALPSRPEATVLELHDTVWAQPIVVSQNKQVSISLLADDDDQIDYEIYSRDTDQEIVHCQGRAVLSREPAPAALDLEQLKGQMGRGQLAPDSVYAACARMGLVYGPSFQGITAIHRGSGQLLAHLRLPSTVADRSGEYGLHPSLMDGALQAAVGLIEGGLESNRQAGQPRLPFALESLRIVSPCTPEMVAWVRYAPGSQAADTVVKLDIDLCDERGNVCVQMRGLSSRALSKEISTTAAQGQAIGSLLAVPVWQASDVEASAGANHIEYTEHHIVLCQLSKVNVEKLGALVPHSQCLSLQAGRQKNIAQRYSEYALACFERIQAILQGKPLGKALVQIVIADHQEQSLLAGLSGLLKTAALENPQLIGQLILAPPEITTEELATHLQAEQPHALDTLIRYEQGARQVLRWQEAPAEPDKPPIAFKDHGVYLITGGLGGLGLLFAKEILAQTRQARVVLTGRSALSAEKQARLDGLSAQAGRVSYRQLDLGNPDQVKRLIAAIQDEYGQLNGILHSAGMMITDNVILKKANAEFSQVLAPKVAGTFNLDQASQNVELDFFVLFSSIASATGNPGTADYATANGFMDQFAAYRNRQVAAKQRHGRTRSINWPLWEAGGMRIDQASQERLRQTTGMQPMRTATGLEAFYRSLTAPYDQILVVEGIQPKIKTYYLQNARISEAHSNTETGHDQLRARVLNEPAGALPDRQSNVETQVSLDQLQQRLKTILATVLRIKTSIDIDQAFVELGLDSFLGAELVSAINRAYGTELSNITVFDYPTVRKLALFLEQELKKLPGYSKQAPAAPIVRSPMSVVGSHAGLKSKIRVARTTASNQAPSDDKIAIIGMSGRYPQANDLQEYWDNLVEGRNSIVEVPPSRWDVSRYYDPDPAKKDKAYSKWLGALDDIDCFDPLFFRISPQEANYIDPHHRLFLQESYKAFEDAGYSSDALSDKKCGVYLGISANEYALLLSKNRMLGGAPVTSNHPAIASARIAYYLNLKGPAISVDTACSSSLVAIHLACQGLLSRETDMALAGGVTLWLTPESYLSMSQAGMLSAVGQCKAFDDTADGIVVGDGVGALVLKRLKDAEADNDFIYGVILGSGVNQDGKTNGITAPSAGSQIELEREIYAKHKIDPETISYVETHGTGTRLGDPIELEALATVFKEKTTKKQYCALGSVKSNIGHTTSAAGVAGVQKVLLAMRHRTLVPSLNVTKETSRFDFKNSPFYIVREKQTWDVAPGSLRRAAVSSFGFSGTNAHLVVEEYAAPPDQAAPSSENGPFIVPLSAKTAEQLEEKARDLLKFIRASRERGQPAEESTPSSEPIDLAAVAYTLQVGRDAMEERLSFVVSSVDQLAEKLSAYINGERNIESAYEGRVEPGNEHMTTMGRDDDMQEVVDRWIARKKLAKLVQSWARGLNVDWNKLYGEAPPRRISLPAYPFAKERYWIDEAPVRHGVDGRFEVEGDLKSIDDIMDKICDDAMETDQAVKLLKALV